MYVLSVEFALWPTDKSYNAFASPSFAMLMSNVRCQNFIIPIDVYPFALELRSSLAEAQRRSSLLPDQGALRHKRLF